MQRDDEQADPDDDPRRRQKQGCGPARKRPRQGANRRPVRQNESAEEGERDTQRNRDVEGRSTQLRAVANGSELSFPESEHACRTPGPLDQLGDRLFGHRVIDELAVASRGRTHRSNGHGIPFLAACLADCASAS